MKSNTFPFISHMHTYAPVRSESSQSISFQHLFPYSQLMMMCVCIVFLLSFLSFPLTSSISCMMMHDLPLSPHRFATLPFAFCFAAYLPFPTRLGAPVPQHCCYCTPSPTACTCFFYPGQGRDPSPHCLHYICGVWVSHTSFPTSSSFPTTYLPQSVKLHNTAKRKQAQHN